MFTKSAFVWLVLLAATAIGLLFGVLILSRTWRYNYDVVIENRSGVDIEWMECDSLPDFPNISPGVLLESGSKQMASSSGYPAPPEYLTFHWTYEEHGPTHEATVPVRNAIKGDCYRQKGTLRITFQGEHKFMVNYETK